MDSNLAWRVFRISDVVDSEGAFSDAVGNGVARLQFSDGTQLAVLPDQDLAALVDIIGAAQQHLLVEAVLRKARIERTVDDFGELEWLAVFNDDDLATFAQELGAALLAATREGSAEELHRIVADWRVTAEVLSDPERRAILLDGHGDSDFVEVQRPK